ncbi:hypothetical protein L2W36_20850 [Vibrio sp. McD22-P3]|nr:hypothetical protein [Vibrio sp. McD22-P3]
MYKSNLMYLTCLSLSLLSTACTTGQSTDEKTMGSSMSSLQQETLVVNDFGYEIQTGDDIRTQFDAYLTPVYRETYITSEQAKKMNLKPGYTFHVYDFQSIDKLDKKIADKVKKDKPIYFTVNYYKNVVGDDDHTEYNAKVTFY